MKDSLLLHLIENELFNIKFIKDEEL